MTVTMRDFDTTTSAILALLDRAGALAPVTDDEQGWAAARATAERLRDRRFLVAVCGEFSSGKSTLLGQLLCRPELFPADVGATTAVPTVVVWGERESIGVVTESDGFQTATPIQVTDLPRFVTDQGNPSNVRKVLEVHVTLPSALLEGGIAFVDLPGLGSTKAAHAVVTNSYLERIDAALFVSTAQTVSETELTFLHRVSDRVGDALVIARSKTDLLLAQDGPAGVDTAVADIRDKASKRLDVTPESLVVVPVSAIIHQAALGDRDEEEASRLPELAGAIDRSITARAGSLLAASTLARLEEVTTPAGERTGLRLAALTEGRTPEIDAIQSDLAERRRALQRLADQEGLWTSQLDGKLQRIGSDAYYRLSGTLNGIRSDATGELDRASDGVDGNAFTSRVLNRVHDSYTSATRQLEREVNEVLTALADNLGVELERVEADDSFHGSPAARFVEPVQRRRPKQGVARVGEAANVAARKSGGWRMLGTAAGLAVGFLLAPATGGLSLVGALAAGGAAGAAIGTAAGTAVSLPAAFDEIDHPDPGVRRRALRDHVVGAITPNQQEAQSRLKEVVGTLQRQAQGTVRSAIKRAKDDVATRIGDLDRDLRRGKEEARAEADRLRPVLTELEALAEESAALRDAVADESARLGTWMTVGGEEPRRPSAPDGTPPASDEEFD